MKMFKWLCCHKYKTSEEAYNTIHSLVYFIIQCKKCKKEKAYVIDIGHKSYKINLLWAKNVIKYLKDRNEG